MKNCNRKMTGIFILSSRSINHDTYAIYLKRLMSVIKGTKVILKISLKYAETVSFNFESVLQFFICGSI